MNKPVSRSSEEEDKGNVFSLLKPYSALVILLIIMALLGSGVNILIPKIIAHGN